MALDLMQLMIENLLNIDETLTKLYSAGLS